MAKYDQGGGHQGAAMALGFDELSDLLDLLADRTEVDLAVPQVNHRKDILEQPGRFWRYSGRSWWQQGSDDPIVSVNLEYWTVVKATPCGVWVVPEYIDQRPSQSKLQEQYRQQALKRYRKLIIMAHRKKWAYPTKAQAWDSFRIRINHRVMHCRNALHIAETLQDQIARIDGIQEGAFGAQ